MIMNNWKYKINGEYLRRLIDNNEPFSILIELKVIMDKMIKCDSSILEDYDFDETYRRLTDDIEDGEENLLKWINSENIDYIEYIDSYLKDVYDYLDYYRIWLTI